MIINFQVNKAQRQWCIDDKLNHSIFNTRYIFNLSIRKKVFPECWKVEMVTPLFKGGSTESCDNYRPISVLPTLGKVLERLVYNQCSRR